MDIKVYKPREELRQYVRYYWTVKGSDPFCVPTYPIGCPQIIFHRMSPFHIPELGTYQSEFTISSQVNFPAHVGSDGPVDSIVVVFHPGAIAPFINTPPSAFYNQEISGYDLGNRELNGLYHRILDCMDDRGAIAIIERWLLKRACSSLNFRRVAASLSRLMTERTVSVARLADTACLGVRQFGRIFNACVGMQPKEYSRVVKFQRALRYMQQGARDYAGIAYACGYSDQSHFIRDFRSMSGYTPDGLLRYTAPYSDLFTDPLSP